jgi:class 3 adenylate cyclase
MTDVHYGFGKLCREGDSIPRRDPDDRMAVMFKFYIDLIRPYVPNPEVDWRKVNFDKNFLSYNDPTVEDEFQRFSFRDLGPIIPAAVWASGQIMFPLVIPHQFPTPVREIEFFFAVVGFSLVAIDLKMLWVSELNAFHAHVRRVVNLLYIFVILNGTSWNLSNYHARCDKTWQFLSGFLGMNPDSANYQHDCIDVVNAYTPIMFGFPLLGIRVHPLANVAAGIVGIALVYVGNVAMPDNVRAAGETDPELVMKLLVYLLAFAMCIIVSTVRFVLLRTQFERSASSLRQAALTEQRREEVDGMLCAMLPASALDRLLTGERISDWTPSATVLFSDMVGFTHWSSSRSAATVVNMLNTLCIEFDQMAIQAGVEKVKTIGDAYWAVCGLPEENPDHAVIMCRFAVMMHSVVHRLASQNSSEWGDVQLRIGVNSGPVSAGLFGTLRLTYEVFGQTSELANLFEQKGVPNRVCIGPETAYQLPDSIEVEDHITVTAPTSTVTPPHQRHIAEGEQIALKLLAPNAFAADRFAAQVGSRTGTESYKTPSVMDGRHSTISHQSEVSLTKTQRSGKPDQRKAKHQQRELFMKRRSRKAELAANIESLEDMEERFSARRFNWIFMGYADPAVEKEYEFFVLHAHMPLRRATRLIITALIVLELILLAIEQPTIPAVSAVLIPVSLVIMIVISIFSFVKDGDLIPPVVDGALFLTAFAINILGCGFIPNSIVGNDPTYIFTLFCAMIGLGITAIPAAFVVVALLGVIMPLNVYFVWSSLLLIGDLVFLFFSVILSLFVSVIAEKLFRRQFLEIHVQAYNEREQQRREAEQRVLLESVVPTHVIPALQKWLDQGMDPRNTIRRHLPMAAIGFIKLLPPDESFGSPLTDSPKKLVGLDEVHSGLPTFENHVTADKAVSHDGWIFEAHLRVDECLAYFRSFDKIKTIGDVVMMAGDFRTTDQVGETSVAADDADGVGAVDRSAYDMLVAVSMLFNRTELNDSRNCNVKFRAGFHVGECLGTVQGTSRLAFDVFGDCVNTASRALYTLPKDRLIGCTESFYASVRRAQKAGARPKAPFMTREVGYDERVEREMKGKGAIAVYQLSSLPPTEVPEDAVMALATSSNGPGNPSSPTSTNKGPRSAAYESV